MRRRSAAPSILVIGLLAIGGLASATLAQDASSTTADSPIVGAWLLDVGNDEGSPPTTGIFHADGTYVQTDAVGTSVGSWAATGPTSGDLTFTATDRMRRAPSGAPPSVARSRSWRTTR